jgi:glutamate racemase
MTQRRATIGVFDSGVGGLTVLKEVVAHFPEADYLYFGDTARLPYGTKSAATVGRYATSSAQFLEERGAELLVVACNTASALALDAIRDAVKIPVLGVIEPGADRASEVSTTRSAVVIATEATVASHAYLHALTARNMACREKACPLLVPLIEEGWTDHPVTEQVARIYLEEAFAGTHDGKASPDVLLLGCTHYPLLRRLLHRLAPREVTLVDSAESTATAVAQKLKLEPLPAPSAGEERRIVPRLHCFATDSVEKFKRLGERFLGHEVERVTHVNLE